MKVGVNIVASGVVQGVGYRFFVCQTAKELNLQGYVSNLYNGRVQIEAEGERGLIEEFIKKLKVGNRLSSVKDLKIEWKEFEDKYSTFDIRF